MSTQAFPQARAAWSGGHQLNQRKKGHPPAEKQTNATNYAMSQPREKGEDRSPITVSGFNSFPSLNAILISRPARLCGDAVAVLISLLPLLRSLDDVPNLVDGCGRKCAVARLRVNEFLQALATVGRESVVVAVENGACCADSVINWRVRSAHGRFSR